MNPSSSTTRQIEKKDQNVMSQYFIPRKNDLNRPFLASNMDMYRFQPTDMDTFPYPRFYRGRMDSSSPHVFNREAGYHYHIESCPLPKEVIIPNGIADQQFCFQAPCGTIFPCPLKQQSPCLRFSP